jgi:hypothetical protein
MDYVNYKVDIMHKLGVELSGWPSEIPFVRPVKLSADQTRDIRDGLRSGAICWVALMKTQREELAKEIELYGADNDLPFTPSPPLLHRMFMAFVQFYLSFRITAERRGPRPN